MSSNNLEEINKTINESITEINNTMEKKKNSLITINENLIDIKNRIIGLKGKLESNKKDINAELEKAKQEANNNKYLTEMIKKIQDLLENINLDKNIEELDKQNSAIENAINDKVKQATREELGPDASEKEVKRMNKIDNEEMNKNKGSKNTDNDEMDYGNMNLTNKSEFSGYNIQSTAPVDNNDLPPHMKKINVGPKYIQMDKDNAKIAYDGKSKLTPGDQLRIDQREKGGISGRKPNPLTKENISQVLTKKAGEGTKGGKRTRKRRRNSRKKKVVKRR